MGTSLSELLANFGIGQGEMEKDASEEATEQQVESTEDQDPNQERLSALLEGGGQEKTAQGGTNMSSLKDLWETLEERDGQMKTAADQGTYEQLDENGEVVQAEQTEQAGEVDIEKLAEAEAIQEMRIEKAAEEYDAAGRIMARGYFDELLKLAAGLTDTHVSPNVDMISDSRSKMPAMGEHGDVQLPLNYAGKEPIRVSGARSVNADALKKQQGSAIKPGSGATENPTVVGGFATIKDIAG
jgi:hypothetical protein